MKEKEKFPEIGWFIVIMFNSKIIKINKIILNQSTIIIYQNLLNFLILLQPIKITIIVYVKIRTK
jgi:hypothetical protein